MVLGVVRPRRTSKVKVPVVSVRSMSTRCPMDVSGLVIRRWNHTALPCFGGWQRHALRSGTCDVRLFVCNEISRDALGQEHENETHAAGKPGIQDVTRDTGTTGEGRSPRRSSRRPSAAALLPPPGTDRRRRPQPPVHRMYVASRGRHEPASRRQAPQPQPAPTHACHPRR